jgi:hypothetical protein
MSDEEEDTCMSDRDLLLLFAIAPPTASRGSPTAATAAIRTESMSSARKNSE